MSDLRVAITSDRVQVLQNGKPAVGFSPGLALYVGTEILKWANADNPQAVEEIEGALHLQDADGQLAEEFARHKFSVQLCSDGDIMCWLDARIIFTAAADDAKQLAGEIITAATEIMQAQNNY
ncbi:MAG: hypothetical protein IID41_10520 [Planctomycetes bacterium]|nr:hypothetical protein [Planctomycetota bacterium]